MLTYRNGSDTGVVVLHEIYGINPHIRGVCLGLSDAGCDVYCPDLLHAPFTPFAYSQQEEAYRTFKTKVGFDVYSDVCRLLEQIRPNYRHVLLTGFSIGATVAWRCSESGLCDGMVGFYGSRIRDYPEVVPKCPVLLVFAQEEQNFDAEQIRSLLGRRENIAVRILKGGHGFCDPYADAFRPESAAEAKRLADGFCRGIIEG